MKRLLRRGLAKAIELSAGRGPKLVFVHIPKCGGTSATNAIKARVSRFWSRPLDWDAARKAGQLLAEPSPTGKGVRDDLNYLQYLLCYHLNCGWKYVSGHYPVSGVILEEYIPEYRFITLLRDPVARWKSNYLWNKQMPDEDFTFMPSRHFQGTLEDEFEEVIASGMGRLMGSLMCAMLTGAYPREPAEALEISAVAQKNLGRFAVVGTLDRLEEFAADVSALIGKPIALGTENETRSRYEGEQWERYLELKEFLEREAVNSVVTEQCAADRLLYPHGE